MKSKKRKLWFITRPERDPKFHLDALEALKDATNNFTVKWNKNRQIHLNYESKLVDYGLKRNNISKDGSGGRTWVAMLKTFSYIYNDLNGYIKLTKVGEELLNHNNIRENITKQILTLQIPNAYYLSSGFKPKFEDNFEITPALFLIKLTNQKQLQYRITKEEITYFALKAKRNTDLSSVTRDILNYRKSSREEKELIKKKIAIEYDHRERSDHIARDFEKAHSDVSHTFMLLCDYTELVEYIRGKHLQIPIDKVIDVTNKIKYFEERYTFSKRYLISLENFYEHAGLDITRYKSNPYGSIGPATNKLKTKNKIEKLLASFPSLEQKSYADLKSLLMEYFSQKESEEYASKIIKQDIKSLNNNFVESFLYEKNNYQFEEKCAKILESIGFKVDFKPKPEDDTVRTEIEIVVHIDEENICILDAKNYKQKFPLTAPLSSHMASTYIPTYNGYKNKNVKSFGYITATDKISGEGNLEKITEAVTKQSAFTDKYIRGSIISAKALIGFLDYCIENDINIDDRKKWFISLFNNKCYSSINTILEEKKYYK
ncbi:restriction endonuclease [Mammaliicoccus sciuri]|uniref:restriction endonuclease n=1 Tax=Mammaliicoccus sciuri TaxID=1296 RepID=UPI003F55DDD4